MESNKFDALARRAVGDDSSRRGVLRAGIGALAASALAVVGLSSADDAAANDKAKKRRKRQHQRDQATRRRHRKIVICYNGETMEVLKNKVNQKFPNFQPGPCVCQGATPLTCGLGCCPVEFPACCPNEIERDEASARPGQTGGSVCAPITSACCPANIGGGACDAPFNQCCPPTNFDPRGFCAPPDAACCTGAQGGGFCPAPFNKCCPPTATFPEGPCCRPGQICGNGPVGTRSNCPAGQVVNERGCCAAVVSPASADDAGATRQSGSAKVGIPAV